MFLAPGVVHVAIRTCPYHGFFPGRAAAGGLVARLGGDAARAAPIFRGVRSVGGVHSVSRGSMCVVIRIGVCVAVRDGGGGTVPLGELLHLQACQTAPYHTILALGAVLRGGVGRVITTVWSVVSSGRGSAVSVAVTAIRVSGCAASVGISGCVGVGVIHRGAAVYGSRHSVLRVRVGTLIIGCAGFSKQHAHQHYHHYQNYYGV